MTPLRSALSNWHLGGQNAIRRTFAAQVDVFVEQGRHNLGRGPVHESLRTQRVEDLVSFLLAQGTGWGRAGLLMPGRWPPTTIERGSGDPERIARGLHPYVRGQRVLWLQFFTRQTMLHVFEGLEAAFTFFGGVPRELLFDQMKAVVTKDERAAGGRVGGRVTENAEFLRFAHHWDFRVRACRPYRAKTKGKVERPVSYVRVRASSMAEPSRRTRT